MNSRKLLVRIRKGDVKNIAFTDFVRLVETFGFAELRSAGSHHLFAHEGIPELLNLQSVQGEAKPYQARQFLALVEQYHLETSQ